MIVLVTDYAMEGPYLGQVISVLYQSAPGVQVVNLFANAPTYDPRATAYLLAAYRHGFPKNSVFLCVVDPGVGSHLHAPIVVQVGEQWFVGPGNGIFNAVMKHGGPGRAWTITWRPEVISSTFHGRDLYAPVAAALTRGQFPQCEPLELSDYAAWPDDLHEIVYLDHFGNAMTGVRASVVSPQAAITIAGQSVPKATTFSDVPVGHPMWYENSNGLAEIAVNQGRADRVLDLCVGLPISFEEST
ncbi:MAG: Adenosyl-chloride synthase [Chromatiales bacterium USCg_Taylor]|nr:MAG: Adenosyl-chloride synthase [Chromatiales bacterium USCg_Taylor]